MAAPPRDSTVSAITRRRISHQLERAAIEGDRNDDQHHRDGTTGYSASIQQPTSVRGTNRRGFARDRIALGAHSGNANWAPHAGIDRPNSEPRPKGSARQSVNRAHVFPRPSVLGIPCREYGPSKFAFDGAETADYSSSASAAAARLLSRTSGAHIAPRVMGAEAAPTLTIMTPPRTRTFQFILEKGHENTIHISPRCLA